MNKETQTQVVSSFSVLDLLGAVLVVLKVLGKITLAWKWVLAPFWIPFILGLGVLGVVLLFGLVAGIVLLFTEWIRIILRLSRRVE